MSNTPVNGLKNHQVASLVNAITKEIGDRWKLPEMLREVVKKIVVSNLKDNNLLLDSLNLKQSENDIQKIHNNRKAEKFPFLNYDKDAL